MKIVQFMASGGYGGAEKVFIELSNALSLSHKVTVFLVKGCTYVDRFSSNVKIINLKSNPTSNNPLLHLELFSLLRKLQPDLIHTHAAKGAMLVQRVNRFLGFNHLGTKHNDRKGRIFNRLYWVSTVSQKAKDSVHSRVGGGVRVIVNGVEPIDLTTRVPNKAFSLLAVGRLDQIKGFDYLIKQVADLDFDFQLFIVGEGPEENNLRELIKKLGVEQKVKLLGFRDDVPQLMRNSDLVIISSHKEGCPKVMVEAFFYAPLLLATPVGDIPHLLPAELITSLNTLKEDISRIYSDYGKSVEMFENIREVRQRDFSFTEVVKKYEQYYEEICSASLSSP